MIAFVRIRAEEASLRTKKEKGLVHMVKELIEETSMKGRS